MRAVIATMNPVRGFCHAVTDAGERCFVHATDVEVVLTECRIGDVLDIGAIERTEKGLRGRQVTWVERIDRGA